MGTKGEFLSRGTSEDIRQSVDRKEQKKTDDLIYLVIFPLLEVCRRGTPREL